MRNFNKINNRDVQNVSFTPINVVMEPDSVTICDIHLLSTLISDIEIVNQNPVSLMKISPNPIKNGHLNYEIALPVQSSDCSIEFINLLGHKTAEFKISESRGTLTLPSAMDNGVYSTSLVVNGKRCFTTKIVIARK